MKKVRIDIDDWKLPIFTEMLDDKNYRYEQIDSEVKGVITLIVEYTDISRINILVIRANKEAAIFNKAQTEKVSSSLKDIINRDNDVPEHVLKLMRLSEKLGRGETLTEDEIGRMAVTTCLQEMCMTDDIKVIAGIHNIYHELKNELIGTSLDRLSLAIIKDDKLYYSSNDKVH